MTINLTPTQLLACLGVILLVLMVWRASSRLLSLTGRVLGTAGAIVGVQWLVITHPGNTTLLLVVLGLPALFAAYTLTRALTVTGVDGPRRKGDR
jgi:hypothetical protein